jgi:outer membrane biosynthesis protein TonB
MISRLPWNTTRDQGHPPWPWIVAFSLLLHVMVFLGLWGMEQYSLRRVNTPSFIFVSLVEQPSGSPPPKDQATEENKPRIKKRIPRPVARANRKLVSIRPPEVRVPERKRAKKEEQVQEPPSRKRATQSAAGVTAAPAGTGGGRFRAEEARYLEVLRERIVENWRAYLPPEEGVLGEVRILISRDGRIREFSFLRGSGKAHVDASIVRALQKVILPPPPSSLAGRPLVLRFWPFGPES